MILGNKIGLRLIEQQDLDLMVQWRNDPRSVVYLNSQLELSHAGQKKYYEQLMNDPTRLQFIVAQLKDNSPVGVIGLAHIDYRNQRAEAAPFVMNPEVRGALLGIDALMTLLRYAFEELNLNRVDGDVIAFNQAMLNGVITIGFKPEGIGRSEAFVQGEWYDHHYFSILREEWAAAQKSTARVLAAAK